MIQKQLKIKDDELLRFVRKDNARNYFIRLALEADHLVFKSVYVQRDSSKELIAALFCRNSGNLQFYANGAFDVDGFSEIIQGLQYKYLISPASYCDQLMAKELFSEVRDGALIAELKDFEKQIELNEYDEVQELIISDLDEVVGLYQKVFKSFSSKEVMVKKYIQKRGRGVCIRISGRIVAVAQSEFEEQDSALIVGVATDPEYQNHGLASKCLEVLCKQLLLEGKCLYLQYDNLEAGRIYRRLGFQPIDRVKHYTSRTLKMV